MINHNLRLISLLFFLFAAMTPVFSRTIRGVDIDRFDPKDDWPQLRIKQKRVLAPFIIESLLQKSNKGRIRNFIKQTRLEKDTVLKTYSTVASIYFQEKIKTKQIRSLQLLRKGQPAISRYLIDYFIGVSTQDIQKRSSICRVPGQMILCRWNRFEKQVSVLVASRRFNKPKLESLLILGREFLRSGGSYVPFVSQRLGSFCDSLYNLGLPLEAAIIAERFTYKNHSRAARHLRTKIPYYLVGAGDFRSAVQFSFSVSPRNHDNVINQARLDWMVLGGEYTRALAYQRKIRSDKKSLIRLSQRKDPFSGFYYSRDGLRLRTGMLLYLNNDIKTASVVLKKLTKMKGEINGVPIRYFARLRLAQILLEENPSLAHKISEDIMYLAQENSWDILEYNATVLDGWALYYNKKYYKSLINFIKARGILVRKNRHFYLHYTHTLGLLAVRQKMKPRGNYTALIQKISKKLMNEPENEALLMIREWAPRNAGTLFFRNLAVKHWNKRRLYSKSISFLSAYRNYQRAFFKSGKNPGGVSGYINSSSWIKKIGRFSTTKLLTPDLILSKNSEALYSLLLKKQKYTKLNMSLFPRNHSFLFSFQEGKSWKLFLVYPSKVRVVSKRRKGKKTYKTIYRHSFLMIDLREGQVEKLRRHCQDRETTCSPNMLAKFSRILSKTSIKQLNILYNPRLSLNLPALLLNHRSKAIPIYFSNVSISKNKYRTIRSQIFVPDGCSSFLPDLELKKYSLVSSFFFSERNIRGIYVWPTGLDHNLSQKGNVRPVYLRNFKCGSSHLRLWDMDRFSKRTGVGLVLYRSRKKEIEIDDAFVEYFSNRQTALLETPYWSNGREQKRWIQKISQQGNINILVEFRKLWLKTKNAKLIMPSLYIR